MPPIKVELVESIREKARQWNPIDRGRVGGIFALLSDDDWRREHQVDLALSQADLEDLFDDPVMFVEGELFFTNELVIEEGLLWDVTHCGVRVMFMKDVFMEIGDGGDIGVLSIDIVGL